MVIRSGEQLISVNEAKVCAESFGSPDSPAVLLICGASGTMDFWEDDFCDRLSAAGRFVIRYDLRDTGRSTGYPAGEPGYTGDDLERDALEVLDGFGVSKSHVYGISMGGAIAQRLSLEHPERVSSLILQSTTPAVEGGEDRPDLPSMEPRLASVFANQEPEPDWSDREAAIEALVESERPFAGSIPFDEERMRITAASAYDRTADMVAMQTNHWILESAAPTEKRLSEITAPTLVMHGTEDPLFPFPHAEALAHEIPDARLVPLRGMGHQYPPEPLWDVIIEEVAAHTGR